MEDISKKLAIMTTTTWILTVFLVVILGYAFYTDFKERINIATIKEQKELLKKLTPLEEREKRIKNMEQTMIAHYKLSWYEAHYYSIIIDDFAQKYDIPWQIYPAVIRIESNFDPTIMSKKGARGMTQVLEKTGEKVAADLGIEWESKKTLWNEIPNMVIGFTYLSEAIKEKGLDDGVHTYIGGPGFDKGNKLVGHYRTTVRWEFDRLTLISEGVKNIDPILLAEAHNEKP